MRIGVDARPIISDKPTGIGIYLIRILERIPENERHQFVLYVNKPIQNLNPIIKTYVVKLVPDKVGFLWICYHLKKQLKNDQIDIFWGPNHLLPLNCPKIKKVLTVHDLALIVNPNWGSRWNAFVQNSLFRLSCKKANCILADSQSTKEDAIQIFHVNPNIVKVHLLGFDKANTSGDEVSSQLISDLQKDHFTFGKDKYLLYVGTIEPRKNLQNVIKSYNEYSDKYGVNYHFILAGKLGWKYKPILSEIRESKYRNYIHVLGYISQSDKYYLLKNTACFIFASNYEGFGLPILEAMQFGVPIITTNISSMPEVGGDAAYYIADPNDISEIAQKIYTVVNHSTDEKFEMQKKEIKKIDEFSWDNCARSTLEDIYRI